MPTDPALGVSSPASRPSRVDFPDPDTPTSATASPARTSKLTSLKMVSSVSPVVTCLPIPEALRMVCARLFSIVVRAVVACALALRAAASFAATIMVFGDSLSAGYGLPREQGWVHLLEQRLHAGKLDYKGVNASISGKTPLGGRNRIDAALRTHRPTIVILELGANDGLRGASPETIRGNLEAISAVSRRAKARVLLVGIRLPPKYCLPSAEKFQGVYREVSRSRKLAL